MKDSAASWKALKFQWVKFQEYEKRKVKCVPTLKWPEHLPLVSVVYKVKIFRIVLVNFRFYIVARIAWNWKMLEEKDTRV